MKTIPVINIIEFSELYISSLKRFNTPVEKIRMAVYILDIIKDTIPYYESKMVNAEDIELACENYYIPYNKITVSAIINDFINTAQNWSK